MTNSSNYIVLNGELIQEAKATIPAISSGLYYGAGAFETFTSEKGKIFKYQSHIDRLANGLEYLGISKKKIIGADIFLDQVSQLLEKNDLLDKNAKVRIQVSLIEKNGYSITTDPPFISTISASLIEKKESPLNLILSETSTVQSSARPTHLKLSNMLHYRQAYREAEKMGASDAVVLTQDGFVAETSIANIFWMKDDTVFTPSEDCDILPGIMRNSILDILNNRTQFEVREGRFGMDELMDADCAWITNSAIGFFPVEKLQDVSFKTRSSFFSDLENQLTNYKMEYGTDV